VLTRKKILAVHLLLIQSFSDLLSTRQSTARVHNVEGILFYYPFEGGRETRPERTPLLCEDDSDPGDEAGTALSKEGELDVPTFDIFWQHRLVPESKVSSLSFFPKGLRSAHQCEAVSVSVNWRRRLRGFLFFDAEFTHISNNKLKIQVRLGSRYGQVQSSHSALRWTLRDLLGPGYRPLD